MILCKEVEALRCRPDAENEFYRGETIAGAIHMLHAAETGCALELTAQIQKGEPDFVPAALTVLADRQERFDRHLAENGSADEKHKVDE